MRTTMIAVGVFAIAPLVPSASAQSYAMDRGVWTVAGTASVSHFSTLGLGVDNGSTSISLFPSVGYFFLPRFLVAATLQYAHSWGNGSTSTGIGAGPRLAYYFGNGSASLHPYVTAAALVGSESRGFMGSTSSYGWWSWRGAGGIALLLARNVAVTGEAFYGQLHYSLPVFAGQSSSNTSSSFGLSFGLSLFLY
jgi:hypothetical protein